MNVRWEFALGLVALGFAAVPTQAARADDPGPGVSVCDLSAHVTLSPGISLTPSAGTIGTRQPGTIDCTGLVNGAAVTGPGQITIDGTYGTGATAPVQGGDTCVQGSGSATTTMLIPTTAGTQRVVFVVQTLALGSAGVATGESADGTRNAALFQFTPDPGQNCTSVPVTGITVSANAINLGPAATP